MEKIKKIKPILIFIIIFCIFGGGILYAYIGNRPNATTITQVENSLAGQGLQAFNITDNAQSNFPNMGLENCIVAEQDDMRFEFYQFDNVKSARKVYTQAYNKIIGNRTTKQVEFEEKKLNYHVYVLDIETDYYVAMYIENTAIYAYCDSENSSMIKGVLNSLGYLNIVTDWNQQTPFDNIFRVLVYALCIPIMYITRIWIWPVVYKSAGISRKKALELGDSRKEVILKLIELSKNPKQTKFFAMIHNYVSLPAYIAVILAIMSCFTDKFENALDAIGLAIPLIMVVCALIFRTIDKFMSNSKNKYGGK